MDSIIAQLGLEPADVILYATMAMVFIAVIMIAMAISSFGASRRTMRNRASGKSSKDTDKGKNKDKSSAESIRYLDEVTNVTPALQPLARQLVPFNVAQLSTLRQKLVRAGFLKPSAVGAFYLARLFCALLFAGIYILLSPFLLERLSPQSMILAGLGALAFGLFLPNIWIRMRRDSLAQQYRNGFPDALDLLVICVEAGLGLDAAISRVAHELRHAHRSLAENFELMSLELRAGSSREEAFKNLSERMDIDEVRSMVTLLLQSEELGTSLADALRIYSDEMRTHRMLRAETKAQALPVKLTIPLGLFVFPTMIIVILLPVMIRIFKVLMKS
ncbi:MAG: type II secretion system F family protein [Rhodospirillaceae bacterium]|nr:type II secretion system F family protein [Rhodospirillaceae bacterium]